MCTFSHIVLPFIAHGVLNGHCYFLSVSRLGGPQPGADEAARAAEAKPFLGELTAEERRELMFQFVEDEDAAAAADMSEVVYCLLCGIMLV